MLLTRGRRRAGGSHGKLNHGNPHQGDVQAPTLLPEEATRAGCGGYHWFMETSCRRPQIFLASKLIMRDVRPRPARFECGIASQVDRRHRDEHSFQPEASTAQLAPIGMIRRQSPYPWCLPRARIDHLPLTPTQVGRGRGNGRKRLGRDGENNCGSPAADQAGTASGENATPVHPGHSATTCGVDWTAAMATSTFRPTKLFAA